MAVASALNGTLEALDAQITEEKREAEERFESLAHDLADGIEFEPEEVRQSLDRAGKSHDDLRALVELVLNRRRQSETADKLDESHRERERVNLEIERRDAEHREKMQPLIEQRDKLERELTAAQNATRLLLETSPGWLRATLSHCRGRTRRLREKMARRAPQRRPSHTIVENGTARAVYDDTFEERASEHAAFCEQAEQAVEMLESRSAALLALTLKPSPNRDDLARIDEQSPEPERVTYYRGQDSYGNPLQL